MKKMFLFFILISYQLILFSQNEIPYDLASEELPIWTKLMYNDGDEGKIIKEYNKYYKNNEFIKNKHTQYYKRWLRGLSREFIDIRKYPENKTSTQWECVGPWDFDQNAESRSYAPGAAHLYTIEQSVNNPNVLYAGSATAGAWKSIDKGSNWFLVTQNLSLGSVYSLEIDFLNNDIVYISGNGMLYKTMDGGATWVISGDTLFNSQAHSIKDIKLDPNNNQRLFVASNQGLYLSNNSGINFTQIMDGSFQEIEFHPNSSDTMYFIRNIGDSTEFYRSDNGGIILNRYSNGWPNPSLNEEQKRTEIAVSPADPDKIVALATGSANGGSGLYGIYISHDKGENWIFQCCGPQPAGPPSTTNINMMGWQDDGSDDGGQYYYDLALAVNPQDANIIHVGGVQHWISHDGGVTFNCPAKWSHPHKKEYVHADIHDINYFGNDLWFACDGGIFYSSNAGDSIYKKMYGIAGTDFWGFGAGFKNGNIMIGGTYHNGTLLKDNNTYINDWISTDGGDNIRGFVNFGNSRIAYSDYGGKKLSGDRSLAITNFSVDKLPNASYIIGESSQIEFDPRCYNWMYVGKDTTLWFSKNNGASFEAIHHFNEKITSVEVAWSNPNVIYIATWSDWWGDKKIYRTSDRGKNWTDITPSNNIQNGSLWRPFDITVSSQDENIVWIARCTQSGGYSFINGYKIFKSTDGGTNWINITTPTLDDDKPTNIEHQRGSDGGIYLGTRTSVYYRNNNMNDWQIYNNNLPKRTFSTQLVPYYREGLLFNGTNRSAYKINFFEDSPPSAQISADKLEINCMDDTVYFVDHSALRASGASWQWNFPGGNPNSSTLENPIVVYNNPGKYEVSLTVTDAFGTSTQTITDLIHYKDTITEISSNYDYSQEFESGVFVPDSWSMPSANFSWLSVNLDTGINCQPTTAAYVNHYWVQYPGEEAHLITNKIKLDGGVNTNNYLTYDYAYSGYSNSYNDGFRIDISTDCGASWDSIYGAYGANLQTTSYQTNAWFPTCGSWKTDSINLSNYGYKSDTIMIRFAAINDYGNHFFLDNIKIAGINILNTNNAKNKTSHILIYPNPTKGKFTIRSNNQNIHLNIWSSFNDLVYQNKLKKGTHEIDLSKVSKGVYILEVLYENSVEYKKLVIQ